MAQYLIHQIPLPVGAEETALPGALAKFLRVPEKSLSGLKVVRKSLDARKRNHPVWKYSLEFASATSLQHPRLLPASAVGGNSPQGVAFSLPGPKVAVVGSGPAGLAAALGLARKGYAVTVFEQGKPVTERFKDIRLFIKQNKFDAKSNILFGEGGAGTFSDGKLTARTRNAHTEAFMKELVACGAEEEILALHHPHLGTDQLQFIVSAFRKHCEEAGATFRFGTEVTDLMVEARRCRGVVVDGVEIPFDAVVLAPGLSAHPLYTALATRGVGMERKDFSVGLRVEHPQAFINRRQLGEKVETRATGAAEYFLTWSGKEAGAYSFCMCPGGVVIPCADSSDGICVNGMSYSNRATAFANSAVVVSVKAAMLSGGVLAGLEYQQNLERKAFILGGGDFTYPAQTAAAFLEHRLDTGDLPRTSFQKPLRWCDFNSLFDSVVAGTLAEAFRAFDRKIPGFIRHGLLIGPESRTSSPVRIVRDPKTLQSKNTEGLYPIGEGAGYSGGIVSSGADGFRLAEAVAAWNRG